MTPLDGYWAAKKVKAFSNAQIEAAAAEAELSDPRATAYLAKVLEERRDAVGRAYFSKVLPLEEFSLRDGALHYKDLGRLMDSGRNGIIALIGFASTTRLGQRRRLQVRMALHRMRQRAPRMEYILAAG